VYTYIYIYMQTICSESGHSLISIQSAADALLAATTQSMSFKRRPHSSPLARITGGTNNEGKSRQHNPGWVNTTSIISSLRREQRRRVDTASRARLNATSSESVPMPTWELSRQRFTVNRATRTERAPIPPPSSPLLGAGGLSARVRQCCS